MGFFNYLRHIFKSTPCTFKSTPWHTLTTSTSPTSIQHPQQQQPQQQQIQQLLEEQKLQTEQQKLQIQQLLEEQKQHKLLIEQLQQQQPQPQQPQQQQPQPQQPQAHAVGSSAGNSQSERICAVCGEKTKMTHYSVPACQGCKEFQKRTASREKQLPVLPVEKDCASGDVQQK
ncbi:putative uncharacterized protein DDB_G0271606 [Acyrthosiphon pisum]|uniref:Nuclear receptor domain-containing protein n=1 Tax=Acyrthosiphon pisum TaxID=7029 RepID=A0A8R2NT47_ACYPI|nr:putative uncharacterized protein DDB_G0271606 [Acyrthosiphon pisum]